MQACHERLAAAHGDEKEQIVLADGVNRSGIA